MASRDDPGYANPRQESGGISLDNKLSSASSASDGSHNLHEDISPANARGSEDTRIATQKALPEDDISTITNSRFFQSGARPFDNNGSTSLASKDTGFRPPKGPFEQTRPYKFRNQGTGFHQGGGGGFRTSRTWISPDAQHHHEFQIIRNAMKRLFKYSEVAKWKFEDYIAHREAMLASQKARLAKVVAQRELERNLRAPPMEADKAKALNRLLPGEQNLAMVGNVGRVLGEKTIWCTDWTKGKEEISPWPSLAEMKWEGDDRAKTGVGRFLALPREPGAPGIPWNQLQVVEQYPIDQVGRIPTMEDIYLPVDEIEDADKYDLINKSLGDAIEEYLAS